MAESAYSSLVWSIPIDFNKVGGISSLRNIDINVILTIKEKILPLNGYISRNTEVLSPSAQEVDPDTGLTVTPFKSTNADWVYYNPDPSSPILSGMLIQPILSVNPGLAYIDRTNGAVYFSGIQTDPVTVTYDYYTVYVQDGYPDWGEDIRNLEDIRLPIVSVDFTSRQNSPFAIGGEYQEDRNFFINVIANSDPERDDLMDIIETSLRYENIDARDYNFGFPIKLNGDINPDFDRGPATRLPDGFDFWHAESRVIRGVNTPEKLRHQGLVMLMVRTY